MTLLIQHNARDLEEELAWFARVLDTRFKLYFGEDAEVDDVFAITPPDLRARAQHPRRDLALACRTGNLRRGARPLSLEYQHREITLDGGDPAGGVVD